MTKFNVFYSFKIKRYGNGQYMLNSLSLQSLFHMIGRFKTHTPHLLRPKYYYRMSSPRRNHKPLFFTAIDPFLKSKTKIQQVVSQDLMVKQIESSLTTELIGLSNQWDIFDCYRRSFDRLINKFGQYSAPMVKIKDGYDRLISSLKQKNDKKVKKIEIQNQSNEKYSENINKERKKIDEKRESLLRLMDQIRQVKGELINENNATQNKIRQTMIHISHLNDEINSKTTILSYLTYDYKHLKERAERAQNEQNVLHQKNENLEKYLSELEKKMNQYLDSIYVKRKRAACLANGNDSCRQTIEKLSSNIEFLENKIKNIQIEGNNLKNELGNILTESDFIIQKNIILENLIKQLKIKQSM
ncbi:hypothetical protein TRFO_17800 [Tritrichomonas foetus]|uniref:Translin-associated factor X-interacting protein 1 N-terminal domain-containing protein n=1 Tax=Tritrichomonas foetus TaxID=1144522 RepID=A0A1J4KMG6_9EUKA|nr:hypothetical protein TRFO_17800 [Tritrichomonas foetus]|eukprot:OHT12419.1 hypothetical protein TRFO_17800 [Tritrichomonas foetus]